MSMFGGSTTCPIRCAASLKLERLERAVEADRERALEREKHLRECCGLIGVLVELDLLAAHAATQASRLLAALEDVLRARDFAARARAKAMSDREGTLYLIALSGVKAKRREAMALLTKFGVPLSPGGELPRDLRRQPPADPVKFAAIEIKPGDLKPMEVLETRMEYRAEEEEPFGPVS